MVKEEWWTNTTVTTDENGFATVEGFKGDYKISVDGKEATAKFVNDDQADICLK